jgi:hypothetical protein
VAILTRIIREISPAHLSRVIRVSFRKRQTRARTDVRANLNDRCVDISREIMHAQEAARLEKLEARFSRPDDSASRRGVGIADTLLSSALRRC